MVDSALEVTKLDASQKAVMFPGEVLQATQPRAFICAVDGPDDKKTTDSLVLTTHRLIWFRGSGANVSARFLRLEAVLGVSISGGGLFSHSVKVTMQLGSAAMAGWQGKPILARIHDKDLLSKRLQEIVTKRLWENSPLPSPAQLLAMAHADVPGVADALAATSGGAAPGTGAEANPDTSMMMTQTHAFSTHEGGIAGIMKRQEEQSKEAHAALSVAFQDVDSLLKQAKTLVEIADRIKAAREREARAGAAAGSQDAKEQAEFDSYLAQLGISNPVTKESSGSDFHQALARELSQMCVQLMRRKGPMITLPDLYCIYNRARRSDLVSPEDLMTACQLLEKLNLPVRLFKFDSGVLVVKSMEMDEAVVSKQIAKLITENGPLTALDISKLRNVPLTLAREEIATAEKSQVLCRDETFEGVVYYVNFFNDYSLPEATPSS